MLEIKYLVDPCAACSVGDSARCHMGWSRGWGHQPFGMRGDLNATSCWDGTGMQGCSKAVLPVPRVPGGVRDASLLPAGPREKKTAPFSACSCLHQCLPVPTPGARVSGLGCSQCWDMVYAGGMVSPEAVGCGQCHQGSSSRRQQTPRSPSVTALIAVCRHWGSFGFHLPEVSGAESTGSWKPGGNISTLAMSPQVLSPLSRPVLPNIPPL